MEDTTTLFNPTDQSTPGFYGPSKTALLLLDFHSLFLKKAGGPRAPAAFETAASMRKWAKSQGIQVIHCLIDVHATPFSTCKGTERFASIVATMQSSDGEEPAELLDGDGGDVTFTRRPGHVSALKSPGIEDFLREKGIRSLVLTGLSTSGCVLRTAITGTDAEYVVTVISDGCADSDQDVHDVVTGKLLSNRGYVVTAAEFQEGFARVAGGM